MALAGRVDGYVSALGAAAMAMVLAGLAQSAVRAAPPVSTPGISYAENSHAVMPCTSGCAFSSGGGGQRLAARSYFPELGARRLSCSPWALAVRRPDVAAILRALILGYDGAVGAPAIYRNGHISPFYVSALWRCWPC